MAKTDGGTGSNFKSSLKSPSERFLSQTVVHVLERGFRTPEDFLRHFKPADLMQGLEGAPDLRAKILIEGAGVHEKIARKKSTTSATSITRSSGRSRPKTSSGLRSTRKRTWTARCLAWSFSWRTRSEKTCS